MSSLNRIPRWLFALVASLGVVVSSVGWAATVTPPGVGSFTASADCPTPWITPGGTKLINGGTVQAGGLTAGEKTTLMNALQTQYGAPWAYTWGADLGGNLTINEYTAYDTHTDGWCRHGCTFSATYSHAWDTDFQALLEGDWTHMQWIQVVQWSHEAIADFGQGEWMVDPVAGSWIDYNKDGKKTPNEIQDQAPFYYNSWETSAQLKWGPGGTPVWAELNFWDKPGISHDESIPWHGDAKFYLMLATWDGDFNPGTNPHNVTIRDAFVWGWDGQCVPLPPGATAIVLLVLLPLRRHLHREDKAACN